MMIFLAKLETVFIVTSETHRSVAQQLSQKSLLKQIQ